MSWIALKMLVGDRSKFCGIVMGLTFAALLITQQGSIFCGLMLRTAAQITDITGADLWVMDPNVRFIDDVKPMSENNLYRVRGVDGVRWAVPLYKGLARAKLNTFDLDGSPRVGVCLDTCHLVAAGYDIVSDAGYADTFAHFDRVVGLSRLVAFHGNDSKKPCGSRVDRHEHVGQGCLGLEPFRRILNDPRFAGLPMMIETEKSPSRGKAGTVALDPLDVRNLETLRSLRGAG